MPQSQGEEYSRGKCFNKKNYDPFYVGPTWDDLLNDLMFSETKDLQIMFCGKFYKGQKMSSGVFKTTQRSVQRVLQEIAKTQGKDASGRGFFTNLSRSPQLMPLFVQELLHLEEQPEHITGYVFWKMS